MDEEKDKKLEIGDIKDFDAIQLSIASPDDVLMWSRGEVTRAETINYRTHRPEPSGLMCERIFGPTRSYQCYCGKYRKIKFKGIVCDKCGVEVTHKSVRRERMGHIKLSSPVVHIWYIHGVPNKLSLLLDIPQKKLQAVVYFSRYMVTDVEEENRKGAKEKIKGVLSDRLNELRKEYNEEIEEERKKTNEKIKALGVVAGNEKLELQKEKIEHIGRQTEAKIREAFKKREEEIRREIGVVEELIDRISVGEILSEEEKVLLNDYGVEFFTLKMGAEAIKALLEKVDLHKIAAQLRKDLDSAKQQKRVQLSQRLRLIEGMIKSNISPTWLVTDVIPVLPADLRPIIQISGGRFASHDLNDLYRRVINRNNRLKRLIELGAPEVILRNEKRMLQEAVDALMDNSHRPTRPVLNTRRIPLKSLSDIFRGKTGRFRQNLLGKRVDYSGRAVIVTAGVDLSLRQCGVPKQMALELFKPFVIHHIIEKGLASNVRNARFMIEQEDPVVWDILDEIIKDYPVLLNRAPTLHKQGIQAFYPVLVDGDSIRIPPMICEGFNADFDGDMMAIHIPLTEEAKKEAKDLLMADKNILKVLNGETVVNPARELIQASYYLTTIPTGAKLVKSVFSSSSEAISAYECGKIPLRAPVRVLINDEIVETTVGRLIFNEILPQGYSFLNKVMNKTELNKLTRDIFLNKGAEETIDFLDKLNKLGFEFATKMGFSPGISDCIAPKGVKKKIDEAMDKTQELFRNFEMGFITEFEKSRAFVSIWTKVMEEVREETLKNMDVDNPLRAVVDAKSRWDASIVAQVSAFKGVIQDALGRTIELPIIHNFVQGLNEFEYFIACKGARKGLIDTAMKTSESGYLTRRLVDIAHGVLIREEDCKSGEAFYIYREDDQYRGVQFKERMVGRFLARRVVHPKSGKVIAKRNDLIDTELAEQIDRAGVDKVAVRSPITCHTPYGCCQKCYGIDLGTQQLVKIGRPIGILAAQALGEPSTQLVLRTFHKGGLVGTDITHGLPRVQELFEARVPKGAAVIAEIDGVVSIEKTTKDSVVVTITNEGQEVFDYVYPSEKNLLVGKRSRVKAGDRLYEDDKGEVVVAPKDGVIKVDKEERSLKLISQLCEVVKYQLSADEELLVKDGDYIKAGELITEGNIDPTILVETKGMMEAQRYTINNIQAVYSDQGVIANDKHIEVIVGQMARYVQILDPGDSDLLIGEYRDKYAIEELNARLEAEGKKPVRFRQRLLGIKAASLKTESFLSAASFQEQVRVLSDAAIIGKIDYLRGLKENVIIGRLIPVDERARLIRPLLIA